MPVQFMLVKKSSLASTRGSISLPRWCGSPTKPDRSCCVSASSEKLKLLLTRHEVLSVAASSFHIVSNKCAEHKIILILFVFSSPQVTMLFLTASMWRLKSLSWDGWRAATTPWLETMKEAWWVLWWPFWLGSNHSVILRWFTSFIYVNIISSVVFTFSLRHWYQFIGIFNCVSPIDLFFR